MGSWLPRSPAKPLWRFTRRPAVGLTPPAKCHTTFGGQPSRSIRRGCLRATVKFLAPLTIVSYADPAIAGYGQLSGLRLNIEKMDLRIAATALEIGAVVVSQNAHDFGRVPNQTVEDWTRWVDR